MIDRELKIQIILQLEKVQRRLKSDIQHDIKYIVYTNSCISKNESSSDKELETIKNKLITTKENKKRELEKVNNIINQLKK